MIGFRVDGNEIVGTGHVMRCLSIANQISNLNLKCVFFVSEEGSSSDTIRKSGYDVISLNSNWDNYDLEITLILNYIKENEIQLLVIDSYYFSEKYMAEVMKYTKTAYIDDFAENIYQSDLYINYTLGEEKNVFLKSKPIKNLLGAKYFPARHCFSNLPPKNISKKVNKILFAMGGTDNLNITSSFVKAVISNSYDSQYAFYIVCGKHYKGLAELKKSVINSSNINILHDINNIDKYMLLSDIAISAAGTTLYELCACGTPTISFSFVDNQLKNSMLFSKEGIIPYAGDMRNHCDNTINNIFHLINNWKDYDSRKNVSGKMRKIIDGKGALRIAYKLEETINN